jgi:hypothetical protein
MALPASLLAAVEKHPCFTGVYHYESPVEVCVDAAQPLAWMYHVSCGDCLTFRVGALSSTLAVGMTVYKLADAVTAHVQGLRGYLWATSGYHTAGSGFWLSAAYHGTGLFLVDGARNRSNSRNEVDLLIEGFKTKVIQPEDPRMLDPALYATQTVYLSLSSPIGLVQSKQDILSSPQCSPVPKQGYSRVTLVEFIPLVVGASTSLLLPPQSAAPASPQTARPPAPPASRKPRDLALGDICPVCSTVVQERPLFSGTFIGCLC